ncbi:MAG TPA: MFS transporter [Woeseiaceae bacterium]|nr:MFS transporter [Woeseiaceae bacterium]
MHQRNLIILVVCQLISATGSIVIVTLGGIIGATLSKNPAWSTLPVSMMVVAVAATTIPAAMLMRRIGRSRGFALASMSSIAALALAIVALYYNSFAIFIAAGMLFGVNMAFTQQYRYAAAESVSPAYVPRAISFVLLGSIGGAFLGPELVARGSHWPGGAPYVGVMFALIGLYTLQALLFTQLRSAVATTSVDGPIAHRQLGGIVRQPVYIVAVLGGTAAYGLMTLLMTATPLSMHVHDGFSIEQTGAVIRAHVLGMYLPSLVSGFLIERFGVVRLMLSGAVLFCLTSVVALQGQAILHYTFALVLLGVGWNFLYVGGTTMLTYTYSSGERFRAQAVNEFLVFGSSALASLAAGAVLYFFGWQRLVWVPFPLIVLIVMALVWVRKDPLLQRKRAIYAAETT